MSTPKTNQSFAEQFFSQVSESVQLVFDLTSRIDERVKRITQEQKESSEKIEKLAELHNQSVTRLALIESNPSLKEDNIEINQKIAILEGLLEKFTDFEERLQNIEFKHENLNLRLGNHDNRWTQIFDAVWKVVLMLIAGYILFKLGIQAPPG